MSTKWRKIWGDIRARKMRTALVSISIFIGVLGVVTISTMVDLVFTELHRSFVEDKLPMVQVWVELDEGVTPGDSVNEAALTTIRGYPDVTAADGVALGDLYWTDAAGSGFIEGRLWSYSETWDTLQIEPVRLIGGRYPITGQQELMLSWQMAERYGLSVGDSIQVCILRGVSGTLENDATIPTEPWTIVGILYHPYTLDDGDYSAYANWVDFTYITGVDHFTQFRVRFTDFALVSAWLDPGERFDSLWEADFLKTLVEDTPYEGRGLHLENPTNNGFVRDIEGWGDPLRALGVLAMLVSGCLVVTVISTILIEEKRQIGAMKTLGATRQDHFLIYSGIAGVYGLFGAIPAVVLGVPLGNYLNHALVAPLTNLLIEDFTISWDAVIIGVALGLLVPLLASVIPVFFGTRVSILEAITDLGISTRYGQGLAARLIARLPAPSFIRQALANIYRRKGRLALTGLTLTLAVGVFMGIMAAFASIGDLINETSATFNYDLAISPADAETDYTEFSAFITENITGVQTISPAIDFWPRVVSEDDPVGGFQSLHIQGFDPRDDSIRLNLIAGTGWAADPDHPGLVVTQQAAQARGWQLGDHITLSVEEKTSPPLEIIGISDYPDDLAFTHWEVLADLGGADIPLDYWLRFAAPHITGVMVDRKIAETRVLLLQRGLRASFYNHCADVENDRQMLSAIALIFNIASLVMAAVGAVGLLAMLSISVFERQREIGVMRAVGAVSGVVSRQFLAEGLLVGLIAWLIGVPLSYGVGSVLDQLFPLGDATAFQYPPVVIGLGWFGMLIVTVLASLWPALSAARKTVSDILRYQ